MTAGAERIPFAVLEAGSEERLEEALPAEEKTERTHGSILYTTERGFTQKVRKTCCLLPYKAGQD